MGSQYQQHRVGVVTVLTTPHKRRYVYPERGIIEQYLAAIPAIIDGDGYPARYAEQELMAYAMCMLSAYLAAGHVVDQEPPLWSKRYGVGRKFTCGESTAQVGELGESLHVYRSATELSPPRLVCRRRYRRGLGG